MRILAGVAILTSLTSVPILSQDKPDLSGTWGLPADAPAAVNGKPAAAPGFGPQINIRQDAAMITISRMIGGQVVHVTHSLDGTETRSRTPGRLCEGDSQSAWTATWQDRAVATTMVGSLPAGATTMIKADVKAVFRLQAPETMAVEVTFRTAASPEPRTTTTIYKRTAPAAALPPADPAPVAARISQVEWLGGTWIGTAGATPTTFEERWTPPAGGSMLSVSRTLRGGVMSAFEFLCIVERNGGLVYQAMPNGRQPATDFTLTRMEPNSLTFENPAHDFPKMIRYTLGADGTLEATISGTEGQKPQVFRFRKQ